MWEKRKEVESHMRESTELGGIMLGCFERWDRGKNSILIPILACRAAVLAQASPPAQAC